MSNQKTKWILDPTHSELTFRVKHLMISNVKGEFRKFDATVLSSGDDFSSAEVSVNIDASSVYTNNDDRDNHLRSDDFFGAEAHPQLTFKSTDLIKLDEDNYQLKGLLQIKGIEKEVTLDVDYGGMMTDPYGNKKVGFTVTGKINRKDWGLNWNAALEAGGVLVSDEVRLAADVQFVQEQ
ncbi:MAG TPA: YceI family protein [Membranihabitans sp.]|nr:YceI family protein [Membranihabitans sp.]